MVEQPALIRLNAVPEGPGFTAKGSAPAARRRRGQPSDRLAMPAATVTAMRVLS